MVAERALDELGFGQDGRASALPLRGERRVRIVRRHDVPPWRERRAGATSPVRCLRTMRWRRRASAAVGSGRRVQ
jgi:hypothetical protein